MDLQKLFKPSSIVIVGVSRESKKVGHLVAKNLIDQGYTGKIFFINPKAKKILGKKVYANFSEINETIDLAVLALPADISLLYLDQLHDLGVKNIILFAAGFKETGEEGKKKEEVLKKKVSDYGMNILGPNCIGFINTEKKINTTFLKHVCPTGNIGFISQSGALGSVLVDYFVSHINLGFSYFISLGNKTIIDESDTLEYLSHDPNTEVIGMYLEDVKDGAKFRTILTEAARRKPVIILKSGRTSEGSQAAVSHTGGLIGDDDVYTALFEQCGAIRAENFTRFINLLKIYSYKRIPTNSNSLVLSNAGGAGVLFTDELIQSSLCLVTISEKTKKRIAKDFGSKKVTVHNPIDLLGDASAFDYNQAIDATFKEKEIGSVIVLLTPQANTEIRQTAKIVAAAQDNFKKPVFPIFMGGKSIEGVQKLFEEHKMVGFSLFDDLPGTISSVLKRKQLFNKKLSSRSAIMKLSLLAYENDIKELLYKPRKKSFLNLADSTKILEYIGVPVTKLYHVSSSSELPALVKDIGFPLVAKIASDEITHKTETKGVITNIKSLDELYVAYKQLSSISGSCYVQQMHSGYELYIGAKHDPNFGPVIIVGLGGIMTELLKDVIHFIYPFDQDYFIDKIMDTKMGKLLNGFRGANSIDPIVIYEIANKIGNLFKRFSHIKELDINPIMLSDNGATVVDARIVVEALLN